MSFFSQFSLPGVKPIAQEKYVVKTVRAPKPPSDRPRPASSSIIKKKSREDNKTGRATLEVPDSRPRSRASSAISQKRKYADGEKSVKRASSSSDLLKPPSPESTASPRGRRAASSSRSPLSQRLESSDEDEEGESSDEERGRRAVKRTKAEEGSMVGNGRKLVNPASFRKASPTRKPEEGHFVHAEMIANMGMKEGGKGPSRSTSWKPLRFLDLSLMVVLVFRKTDQKLLSVKLQYPGVTYPERYIKFRCWWYKLGADGF